MEIQVVDRFNLVVDYPEFATSVFIRRWHAYPILAGEAVRVYVTYVPSRGYLVAPRPAVHPEPDPARQLRYWCEFEACPANVREAVSPLIWIHKMRNKELQDGDTSS